MSPSTKKSKDHKLVAVFDIESGSVGASILCVKKGGPTEVLAGLRTTLPYEDRDKHSTAAGILTILSSVGQKVLADFALQKKFTDPIDDVYAVIRAPWTNTRTVRAERTFDTETVITESLINELAQEALAKDGEQPNAIFETTVIRVELNGYPTSQPAKKSAHIINVSVLVSDCDIQIHTGTAELLSKFFPSKTPILRSGVRTTLSVLQEFRPQYTDYVIIDMASKGTNAVNVINSTAVAHETIEEGVYSILSRISAKRLPEEALTSLRMIAREQCTEDVCDAMNLAMGLAETDMAKLFGEVFGKLSSKRRLPNHLFLFTHADIASWLTRFFTRIDFSQFTQTTQPFTVEALSVESFSPALTVDSKLTIDIGLATASALVHMDQ